jgi:NAD(P)-dependent dehydrogenase (short-subunit alcohol dehydrogenase family)
MRAVITGAGSGIGRATALRLARDGGAAARLVLVDLHEDALERVAREIAAQGGRGDGATLTVVADVGDPAAIQAVGTRAAAWLDGLDALVSNAGFFPPATPLISMDLALFDRMFDVNTRATWLLAQAMRPLLAAARGSIVATASISAEEPTPGICSYSANKAALVMLVRQLALELGPAGVRCNCVSPGTTRTGINDFLLSDPAVRAAREAMLPLRRIGQPEDLANAIAFLVGPDAAYITGVNLLVDGGLNLTLMPSLARATAPQ